MKGDAGTWLRFVICKAAEALWQLAQSQPVWMG